VDASVPDPWPVEIALECSVFSPVPMTQPKARARTTGSGLGFWSSPDSLQNLYFIGFDDAGVRTTPTRVKVTNNVIDTIYGSDFVEVPGGGGDLWFPSLSNARRPMDPIPPPGRRDLRVARANSLGVMQGNPVLVFNDQPCPGSSPDGGLIAPEIFSPPRVVALATGPFVAWRERISSGCPTSANPMVKVRGVWLNNDLSVRAGPMDLTDPLTEHVTSWDIATDGVLVALAYAHVIRTSPQPFYGDDRIKFRAFLDGQQTTLEPTTLVGYPCPDQTDPSGLAPATTTMLPDGGTQCPGQTPWNFVSLAVRDGLALAAFNVTNGPLHVVAVRLETGPLANLAVARLRYAATTLLRPVLTASDTGYSLVGFTQNVYLDGAGLTTTPMGSTLGSGVALLRLDQSFQFREGATLAGVSQFGVSQPASVTSRGGRSLLTWSDAPSPGGGATRLRQKASFVTCP
jgi:hypothetical protein